ncbi:DUF2397 family protein, partial [Streptomyces sp. W16]|uniref:DUF2397 family protein n=1 Tax=Streptomyces sp. W16 TaxID=3076631 RepID=UPI00295B80EB
ALAARADAEATLRARSGTTLADWDPVSEPELDLLLELLGVARGRAGLDVRAAVTGDGRWRVTLTPPGDGPATAALYSPRGQLVTLNWLFELEPAR